MNRIVFEGLRRHLIAELLRDPKIGISPSPEPRANAKPKVKCLRCDFKFIQHENERICYTCTAYNKQLG